VQVLLRKSMAAKAARAVRRWVQAALARGFVPWSLLTAQEVRKRRLMTQVPVGFRVEG